MFSESEALLLGQARPSQLFAIEEPRYGASGPSSRETGDQHDSINRPSGQGAGITNRRASNSTGFDGATYAGD